MKIVKNRLIVDEYELNLEEGKVLCFDFDGVIHKYREGWKDGSIYDDYNKDIIEIMQTLQENKIPIFICSTRDPKQIIEWWNKQNFWCEACEIENDRLFWTSIDKIGVTNRKLPAELYIDDRAYVYAGENLKEFIDHVNDRIFNMKQLSDIRKNSKAVYNYIKNSVNYESKEC